MVRPPRREKVAPLILRQDSSEWRRLSHFGCVLAGICHQRERDVKPLVHHGLPFTEPRLRAAV